MLARLEPIIDASVFECLKGGGSSSWLWHDCVFVSPASIGKENVQINKYAHGVL